MQWENLTVTDFAAAVRDTGVCVLALGVLEKHSEHLPLGTDMLIAHRIACLAAAREPAVVFPPFYFGQIYEARAFPGMLTLKPTLLIELIQNVLDKIARNGFRKIILYNGHGGNHHLLRFLAQCSLAEPKPYSLYLYTGELNADEQARWNSTLETTSHGHARECETSPVLAGFPNLVHMERVPAQPADPLKRMSHLPGAIPASGGTPIIPITTPAMRGRPRPRRATSWETFRRGRWRASSPLSKPIQLRLAWSANSSAGNTNPLP